MSYGRFQLGQFVPLTIQTKDASDTPTVPTAPPFAEVWAAGVLVKTVAMPVVDRFAVTGLFRYRLPLATFSTGHHVVLYHYVVGSLVVVEQASFTIIAGGDADGAITAMTYYERPQANFLVYATDQRKLRRERNPRV